MSADKGRALFLQALEHRFYERFDDAALAFEAAVEAGNGDACWHLYCHLKYGGFCRPNTQVDRDVFLTRGIELGNQMCIITLHDQNLSHREVEVLLKNREWRFRFPGPLNLDGEVFVGVLWSGIGSNIVREFSVAEVNTLKENALKALAIHDPVPVASYINYITNEQPELLKFADPVFIAHALFLFDNDPAYTPEYELNCTGYKTFNIDQIISDAFRFKLSIEALHVIQCVFGKLCLKYGRDSEYVGCYDFYRQEAQQATIAWLGCYKRKALPFLSRDTATLIASMIAPVTQWAKT